MLIAAHMKHEPRTALHASVPSALPPRAPAPHALDLPPLTHEQKARLQLDIDVRYWGLRVRGLVQKLLSLGRTYEVRYHISHNTRLQLPDLGFDVLSISDAHLLQVRSVASSRYAQQIVNEATVPGLGVARPEDIQSICVEDYLVGVDSHDLLVAPIAVQQLRKRMQHPLPPQPNESDRVVTMRFVRLDRHVQVNHVRTHGYVLETLALIEAQDSALTAAYAALLERHHAIVAKDLKSDRKLLTYVRIVARDVHEAIDDDERFAFAFGFAHWLEALDAADDDADDDDADNDDESDDDDADAQEAPHDYFDVEISDDSDASDREEEAEDEDDARVRRSSNRRNRVVLHDDDDDDLNIPDVVDLTTAGVDTATSASNKRSRLHHQPPASALRTSSTMRQQPLRLSLNSNRNLHLQRTQTPAASPTPKPKPKPKLRTVDMHWLELFAKADLKWLKNPHAMLSHFISGLLEGFDQDHRDDVEANDDVNDNDASALLATAIAEQLVRVYIRKRFAQTPTIDNATLYKEFARHVRMLLSNVKNANNAKLRDDLRTGAVPPARLCEMSVDELAPEALRRERERRFEQHAKSNMLQAPTGKTLVKTKHGYKEVDFGELMGVGVGSSDAAATATATETEMGAPTAASTTTVAATADEEMPFAYDETDAHAAADARDLLPDDEALRTAESNKIVNSNAGALLRQQNDSRLTPSSSSRSTNQSTKRVTFADAHMPPCLPNATPTTPTAAAAAPAVGSSDHVEARKHKPRERTVAPAAGRAFLLMLVDPAQDVVEWLRMFIETLETAPLATMSREFVIAPDVTLYRDSRANTDLVFTARLQLAHLTVDSAHPSERRANIYAARRLIDRLEPFQHHLDTLLRHLRRHFALSAANNTRKVRDSVHSYLVEKSVAKLSMPPPTRVERDGTTIESFVAISSIFDVPVATSTDASFPVARDDASQHMLAFLIELLAYQAHRLTALQQAQPPPQLPQAQQPRPLVSEPPHADDNDARPPRRRRSPPDEPIDNDDTTERYIGDTDMDYVDVDYAYPDVVTPKREDDDAMNRKRYLEPSHDTWTDEPKLVRRRTDDRMHVDASNAPLPQQQQPPPPMFYVDNAGERTPHADRTQRIANEEQRIKAEVDAYQGLIAQMFKQRDVVVAKLHAIDWNLEREVESIGFADKFTVVRRVQWFPATQRFECVLEAFGRRLMERSTDARLETAAQAATAAFIRAIDKIFTTWQVVVRTYSDRKRQTPTTLMAANEARMKNQQYTDLVEKRAGHLYECCIYVNQQMAIRHACLNAKMAKRSASEEFRDVLDAFAALEVKRAAQRAALKAAGDTSASANTTAAPAATADSSRQPQCLPPQPPRRKKADNLVLCSSDEDDDDDDSDDDDVSDYSTGSDDGGSRSAASSTAPRAAAGTIATTATTTMDVKHSKMQADAAGSLRALIEAEKLIRYDVASEQPRTDDARLRAIVRSLFTENDALCNGIAALRGSLKFRGRAENTIVPNVTASIDMERLRGGTIEVHVAVNDLVTYTASEYTKADACNAAIDGVLAKLRAMRSVWVQLLNFFHTKELATDNIMDSFHALRLANITSIVSTIETPVPVRDYSRQRPSATENDGVHCVLRVGGLVVYRVVGGTEEEVLNLADCRTAKFISHLIDDGLDPHADDVADAAEAAAAAARDAKIHVDSGGDTSNADDDAAAARSTGDPDWSCEVRVSDFIDTTEFHTFRVDATWRQARDLPPIASFPPPPAMVATQVEKVPMWKLEEDLRDWHGYVVKFFSIESAHEQWKLVRYVAAYGHKNRRKAFALRLTTSPSTPFDMYLIPPGASINSDDNLYWPKSVLPRSLPDRKQIYGFLKVR